MLKRWASNAGANVLSGGVGAGYQLGLTAVATRVWHGADFAAWGLALSISAIAQLFGANLSSMVTRRLVSARYGTSPEDETAIVVAGRRLGLHLSLLAICVLMVGGAWVRHQSPAMNLGMLQFLVLLLMLLGAQAWMVFLQPRFGQFYAQEDNWTPALTLTANRLGGLVGFVVALQLSGNALLPAGFGLLLGSSLALLLPTMLLRAPTARTGEVSPAQYAQQYRLNLKVFAGFGVWAVGALVIQFGLPPLVAIISPSHFNAFYLASTLNMIALGLLSAAMSALLAPLSRWHSCGQMAPLRRMALYGPVLCALGSLAALVVAWFALGPLMALISARATSAEAVRPFLALLGFQTIVRTAAMGYSISLASVGSTRQMSEPILLEISVSLAVAAPLGLWFGPEALIGGLVLAGALSALRTCHIGAELSKPPIIRASTALACFVAAQAFVCLLWWRLVHSVL